MKTLTEEKRLQTKAAKEKIIPAKAAAEKRVPTKEQQEVIDSRGENLLVSASAGSGKTSTMIDRIAALISEGASATEILALTFTKAAAAEMREKLWNKLCEAAAENPRIKNELADFALVNMGTIDSFCADLLRANFAKAGIDPTFSVLEGVRQKVLFSESLAETLENCYEENTEEFYLLLDAFGKNRRDKGLKDVIEKVYECAINTADPDGWLARAAENYNEKTLGRVTESLNAEYIRAAGFYRARLTELAAACHTAQMAAHTDALQTLSEQIAPISAEKSFEANYNFVLAFAGTDFPVKSNKFDVALHYRAKATRDNLTEKMKSFQGAFFGKDFQKLKEERERAAQNARTLAAVTQKFKAVYDEKKAKLSALDFSDLEHAALGILSDTETRDEVAGKYKYVFVDEYQDVNELQESILKKLCRDDNRFMVGDIKQSIYAFRHSDPAIIKARMSEFSCGAGGKRINLSQNFRSHPDVLDFANLIFENIMSDNFGGADYRDGHSLVFPPEKTAGDGGVSVDIITGCNRKRARREGDLPMPYDINAESAPERFSDADAEALVIAGKIKELLEKGLTCKDIVILTRSQKNKHVFGLYKKLRELDVPVVFPPEKAEDANSEIETLLNFMSVIDNPLQDIPLAAVLGSFLYGFSANELTMISRTDAGADADFFNKFAAFAETAGGGKAKMFLEELARYRQLSKSVSAAELLTKITNEKSVEKYVRSKPDGAARAAALLNFLSALSDGAYGTTVGSLCAYVEQHGIEKVYSGSGDENAVRMLSVHASKGLEYPAVIFAGLGCDSRHTSAEALADKNLGIAVKYYDTAARQKTPTLNYAAAKAANEACEKEESLRILYVALTRAKKYLCLTGCMDGFPEADAAALDPFALSAQGSFIDLIAAVIANRGGTGFCLAKTEKSEIEKLLQPPAAPVFPIKNNALIARLQKRMEYSYPYVNASESEYKMAASTAAKIIYPEARQTSFVSSVADGDPRKPTTEEGTLYHKVLLYINLASADVKAEIDKLAHEGVLTAEEAAQIDAELIGRLLGSDLMKRAAAVNHFREQPFMMLVPAAEIEAGQDKSDNVIIQGIIDLMFFDKEGIIIIDYKYSSQPADRLAETYASQLKLYARAAETVLCRPVHEKYLINILSGEIIKVF